MSTTHHTPLPFGGPLTSAAMEAPLSQLDTAIQAITVGSGGWATTLDSLANAGQKVVPVVSTTGAVAGMPVYIGLTSGTHEVGVINTISAGVSVTLVANLANTYAAGTPISATPAEVADARGAFGTLALRLADIDAFPGGTSFPGGPANNDLWRRTDWQRTFYWNGTRWLCTQELSVDVASAPVTATAVIGTPLPDTGETLDLWVTRVDVVTKTSTPNDVGNYWTIYVTGNHGAIQDYTFATVVTSGDTIDEWTRHNTPVGRLRAAATTFFVMAAKTGAPGALNFGAHLYAREVGPA